MARSFLPSFIVVGFSNLLCRPDFSPNIGMEGKMAELKKASHCWWFESHNSAKRSPWLQSTLSELEKNTKGMLNLIEGDADSFAQRAETYYRKRPELVNMIEDFYRSYRYLAEQHELLRCEVGTRRPTFFKCDSIQSSSHKTWDSTDTSDYPESEISEVDNLEQAEDVQIESVFAGANEEIKGYRRNLEVKSSVLPQILDSAAARESEAQKDLFLDLQDEIKLMELPLKKENDQETLIPMNDKLEVCFFPDSDNSYHHVNKETVTKLEMEDYKVDDLGTKVLYEKKSSGDVLKLTSEVDGLRIDNWALMAELERKDEEKRDAIRQLSVAVNILKEENVTLKKFIKESKRPDSFFQFKKLKVAFSRTGRLFSLTPQLQPSLVAL